MAEVREEMSIFLLVCISIYFAGWYLTYRLLYGRFRRQSIAHFDGAWEKPDKSVAKCFAGCWPLFLPAYFLIEYLDPTRDLNQSKESR